MKALLAWGGRGWVRFVKMLEALTENPFGITGHTYIPEHSLKINATSSVSTGII